MRDPLRAGWRRVRDAPGSLKDTFLLSCRCAEVCASLFAFVLDPYPWMRRNNKSRTDFQTFGKAWPQSSDTTCIQSSPRSATI